MRKLNERLKKLRKALGMTQQEFADSVGTARNNIAGYETDKRQPSVAVISLICKTHNVSENWLRTGEGDMFNEVPRDEQIADFVGEVLKGEEESFKRRFMTMLSELDESDWESLEKIATLLEKKKD